MLSKPDRLILKTDRKIKTLAELEREISGLKNSGSRIVLTHGVFDLVHPGHAQYFEEAKSYGDILVVSVIDDTFVRKGRGRPIFSHDLRLSWLAALEAVDFVVLCGYYAAWNVMKAIKPDVYVRGYSLKRGVMKDVATMRDVGGKMVLIPEMMHSTEIFEVIKKIPIAW
ncbi:MAG: adenylyltransferase/cytidyltransferase family protein [Candidatus Niyogibacteria bacterium]|nr:adenylyltransferase/cytidyltransferase family protein [Candidatus Niyogibacteria bacterium]